MGRVGTGVRNRIRTLRFLRAEMTQQELAERIGVTRQTVNAIEGGKYSPSLEVAFRIALALDAPLEEVFQYEPPVERVGRHAKVDQARDPARDVVLRGL